MQKAQPSTSKETLSKIKQPVLVICSEKNTDNGSANEMAKLLPNSVFAIIPGDHNHAPAKPEFSKKIIE